MQNPIPMSAMFGNCLFYQVPLLAVKRQLALNHQVASHPFDAWIRFHEMAGFINPTAIVARQPRAVRGPGNEIGERIIHWDATNIFRHISISDD
jgi:hypothetical protein